MHSDALFEVRPSPKKGLGAFAIQDIPAGTCVHTEVPFIVYLRYGSPTEQDLELLYDAMEPKEREIFSSLRLHNRPFSSKAEAFRINQFEVEHGFVGMFIAGSRLNHSCLPNVVSMPSIGRYGLEMYAVRPIAKDEELTFTYTDDYNYMPTAMRRSHSQQLMHFTCSCEACQLDTPFNRVSDMRRQLLYGLRYLYEAACGIPSRLCRTNNPIVDSKLLQAIKNGTVPRSLKVLWCILSAHLLVAEGLVGVTEGDSWYRAAFQICQPTAKGERLISVQDCELALKWSRKAVKILQNFVPKNNPRLGAASELVNLTQRALKMAAQQNGDGDTRQSTPFRETQFVILGRDGV